MVTTKTWTAIVVVLGLGIAVILCLINGFFPATRDISDPLGRPSKLSSELIHSAGQFDTLTGILVPKHDQLSGDIQTLGPLADNLAQLTDRAGELSGSASTVNGSTSSVSSIAGPLPDLIASVTGRANQAAPTVGGLTTAVGSVAGELDAMHGGLTTIQSSLAQLGPKASSIAQTLAVVQEEAAHVREFGPLLAVIGPPVNSLGIPALGVPVDPNAPAFQGAPAGVGQPS